MLGQELQQRRLADTGFATQDGNPAMAVIRVTQNLIKERALSPPSPKPDCQPVPLLLPATIHRRVSIRVSRICLLRAPADGTNARPA